MQRSRATLSGVHMHGHASCVSKLGVSHHSHSRDRRVLHCTNVGVRRCREGREMWRAILLKFDECSQIAHLAREKDK